MEPIEGAAAPNAMVNDQGDYFYPDSVIEANVFIREHGARPVDAGEFYYFFRKELFVLDTDAVVPSAMVTKGPNRVD